MIHGFFLISRNNMQCAVLDLLISLTMLRQCLKNRGTLARCVFEYYLDDSRENQYRVMQLIAAYIGEPSLELFVMLDLDGTLVADDTEHDCVVLRPGVGTFLQQLASQWPGRLSVFTAASPERAQLCVNTLQESTGQVDLFAMVWSGERTRMRYDMIKGEYYKQKLLRNVAWKPAFARRQGWNRHNTILVDNTPRVARHTYANLLCIETFNESDIDQPERAQRELKRILDRLYGLREQLWMEGTIRACILQEKIAHLMQYNQSLQ